MKTLATVLCILSLATVAMAVPTVTLTTVVGDPTNLDGTYNPTDVISFEVWAVVSGGTLPVGVKAPNGTAMPDISSPHQGGIVDVTFDVKSSTAGVLGFDDGFGGASVVGLGASSNAGNLVADGIDDMFVGNSTYSTLSAFNTAKLKTARGETSTLVASGVFTALAGGTTTLELTPSAHYAIAAQIYALTGSGTAWSVANAATATETYGTPMTITVTPEPMTLSLLALGALGLIRRKRA